MAAVVIGPPAANTDLTNVPTLGAVILRLIGQPFLFARMGYAGELSLHFGAPQNAKHPRLRAKGIKYGSYILSARGSAWLLRCEPRNRIAVELLAVAPLLEIGAKLLGEAEITADFIVPGQPVIDLEPFYVDRVDGMGIRVETADGSGVVIIPTPDEPTPEDKQIPADVTVDKLADWELKTPAGLVQAGPGKTWRWTPNGGESGQRTGWPANGTNAEIPSLPPDLGDTPGTESGTK